MATDFHYYFEWDAPKAQANVRKHGIAFEQAATVFRDPLALSLYDEDHSQAEEDRWITLGQDEAGQLLVVIHTHETETATTARIRIISARPATKNEQRTYQETTR